MAERPALMRHRREVRWQIILPASLFLLLVVIGLVVVLLLPMRAQVGLVADLLALVLLICPATLLCALPLAIVLGVAAWGMNSAHRGLLKPLGSLEQASERLAGRADAISDAVNARAISASARLGPLYKLLGYFEQPASPRADKEMRPDDPDAR